MDDDEMVRDAIGTMVEYLGHEAAYAGDGEEAIALYKGRKTSDPFDAAIFDLTVQGGMGGKEAMQKLVKFDPEVKVIVTSGYSTDPVVQNFRKYGFVDVLAKPYSIHQLKDLLERL
jgi:DNA-binding NtrC family response regulator